MPRPLSGFWNLEVEIDLSEFIFFEIRELVEGDSIGLKGRVFIMSLIFCILASGFGIGLQSQDFQARSWICRRLLLRKKQNAKGQDRFSIKIIIMQFSRHIKRCGDDLIVSIYVVKVVHYHHPKACIF